MHGILTPPFSPAPHSEEQSWDRGSPRSGPSCPTWELTPTHHSQPGDGGHSDLPASETWARNLCCHYLMRLGQRQPPAEDEPFVYQPPCATACEQEGSRGLVPISFRSNFTHCFSGINKLVTFALLLACEVSNNTLIPSENTSHWHVGALVTSLPTPLLKASHVSRGQALAWARAELRTRAMASRHCLGAQRSPSERDR